jgi:hypothetical protein
VAASRKQIEVEIVMQTRDPEDLNGELKLGEPRLGEPRLVTVADAADGGGRADRAEARRSGQQTVLVDRQGDNDSDSASGG